MKNPPLPISSEPIAPGDLYLAKKNTGWKLLTCKSFHKAGFIVPEESGQYCYDLCDCHKVEQTA